MKRTIILILLTFLILSLTVASISAAEPGDDVIIGGMPFGIKFYTDGVIVCGISDVDTEKGNISPGHTAGIKKGDIITKINNDTVESVNDIIEYTKSSGGKKMVLTVNRNGKSIDIDILPIISVSENEYKLGLWIKDGTAGIGTVTYIEKGSNSFAGLGHGVCDIETAQLMKMKKADVCDVTVTSVNKSSQGSPGELKGFLCSKITGKLTSNTEHGVFGVFNSTTSSDKFTAKIAEENEIKEGSATILCTLDDNNISEFNIIIEKLYNTEDKTKNFIIRVTDDRLLKKTGGIVQGMSGSPIIQNGKLVGAVTHVLVEDPTRGYGIFIHNMLKP